MQRVQFGEYSEINIHNMNYWSKVESILYDGKSDKILANL